MNFQAGLFGSLLVRAKRWTTLKKVPIGCWQCWRECWGSGVQPLFTVRFAWMRSGVYMVTLHGNATVPFLDPMQHTMGKILQATHHAASLTVRWLLVIPHTLCQGYILKYSAISQFRKEATELKTEPIDHSCFVVDLSEISLSLEALGVLGTFFWCAYKRAQQQTCHLSLMVYSSF